MFKCQATGKISKPGEKPVRVVLETRPKTYENEYKDEDDKWRSFKSEGYEIVREIIVSAEYYETIKETNKLAPKA